MKAIKLILITLLFFSCNDKKDKKAFSFIEDFEGVELNETYWNYELGDGCPDLCGWGNNERQVYTKENIKIEDGKLIITASKDSLNYFSGKITTKDKVEFKYGTIEVKAKLPTGQGIWPAIWMLGHDISDIGIGWPKCGEIDIMEYVGKNPHQIHNTMHTPDSYGQSKNTKISTIKNIEEGFHVYKSNWTKDAISFYIDENLVYTFSPDIKNDNTWPFDKPFYIILNLAIGGNFGGPEVDDSIFPQEFIIDYVKVSSSI